MTHSVSLGGGLKASMWGANNAVSDLTLTTLHCGKDAQEHGRNMQLPTDIVFANNAHLFS